jgi:outer membrane protein assembly factor BamB
MMQERPLSVRSCASIAALVLLFAAGDAGAEWTKWGGPTGDFHAKADVPDEWSESLPKLVWKRDLGDGESSILVDGETLYTVYRDAKSEVVVALESKTGKTLWEHRYEAPIPESLYVQHGNGPHATSVVAGGRLCALGITGKLHCLDKKSGAVIWSHDLIADYDGKPPACGYGGSPLVHEDTLIVQAGGKEGHGVMAFKLDDGKVAWKSQDGGAGYAAATLIEAGDEQQLIVFMGEQVVGLDPDNGMLMWKHAHKTQYGVNASTPLYGEDGILFISSAYDNGSRGLRLTGDAGVKELWHQNKMQLHFTNAIRIGNTIYGTSGDFGPVFLTAVDALSGEIVWQKRDIIGKASMLLVGDDRLLMLDEKGKLVLASVSREDVNVLAERQLFEGRSWAPPTLVGSSLYARDRRYAYRFDLR